MWPLERTQAKMLTTDDRRHVTDDRHRHSTKESTYEKLSCEFHFIG